MTCMDTVLSLFPWMKIINYMTMQISVVSISPFNGWKKFSSWISECTPILVFNTVNTATQISHAYTISLYSVDWTVSTQSQIKLQANHLQTVRENEPTHHSMVGRNLVHEYLSAPQFLFSIQQHKFSMPTQISLYSVDWTVPTPSPIKFHANH